jgi:antitoxin MazE
MMKTTIRKLGNSHGVIIPQMMLLQSGIQTEAEMSVEKGVIVLRKPANTVRAGWAEAGKRVAAAADPEPEWS